MHNRIITDLKFNQFPKGEKYTIFQAVKDLIDGYMTLQDLHRVIKANPKALGVNASITNIKGAPIESCGDFRHYYFDAEKCTPLHYAYLAGREDVFALLLATGADIDDILQFSCLSIAVKSRKTYNRTLHELMKEYKKDSVLRSLATNNIRVIYLNTLIRRQDIHALTFMMYPVEKPCADRFAYLARKGWQENDGASMAPFEEYTVDVFLDALPSAAKLKEELGIFPQSFTGYLIDLVCKLGAKKSHIQKRSGNFAVMNEALSNKVVTSITELQATFKHLLIEIGSTVSAEDYKKRTVNNCLEIYRNYANEKQKSRYTYSITYRVDWKFNDENPMGAILLRLARMLSLYKGKDIILYCEAMLTVLLNQLQAVTAPNEATEWLSEVVGHIIKTPSLISLDKTKEILGKGSLMINDAEVHDAINSALTIVKATSSDSQIPYSGRQTALHPLTNVNLAGH